MPRGRKSSLKKENILVDSSISNLFKIADSKVERIRKLRGKWVLVCISKYGENLYLCDTKVEKDRLWTHRLDCAVGFKDYTMASEYMRKYRSSRPRLVQVSDLIIIDAIQQVYSWLHSSMY